MKRKVDEDGECEGPPQKMMYGHPSVPIQYVPVGWPPMRGQGNMRGGIGFRIARGGPWRGPRMPNNQHPRGYFRGGGGGGGGGRGGRGGGPMRYNHYDMSVPVVPYQEQYQMPHWHQPPPYQHDQHGDKNDHQEVDSSTGASASAGSNTKVVVDDGGGKGKQNKRRPMSQSYPSRPWNKEDAERALAVETTFMKVLRNQSLIIRFPDPELSKDMVKTFHPGITNVHFQVPSGPRYCFVQLSEKINTEKTIKELEQIKFGSGKLIVEKKFTKEEEDLSPEAIDPYTLYIGNLPTNVNVASVKEKFPTASRIDIGFAQRMKFTRYAFIRYNSVDEAIEAYKHTHNLVLDSRSIIVRFRRQRGPVGMPGESRQQKNPKGKAQQVRASPARGQATGGGGDKSKVKGKKEKVKPKEEKPDEEPAEDEEENEDADDDDDDDDEEEEDDDDDDDDDDEEEDDDDDDDEEEGEEEGLGVAADDDPDDDDDDDDDDDEDDEEDLSRNLFDQIDTQIADIDGSSFNSL